MRYLITETEQGCGFKTVINQYERSFKSKDSMLGFIITREEYLNDGSILKITVDAEPIEKKL